MSKELFTYYSLSECANPDEIVEKLDDLSSEMKIDFKQIDVETIKISDLELSDKEINNLIKLFDKSGVIVDLDYDEVIGYDDGLDEYFSDDYDY